MNEHEITLTTLAYGGEALGRLPDGRAVFVPFALPGEKVRIRLVEEKRGYARAELLEVLQPAAERIPARCAHFGDCGGCHYQHMSYPTQAQAKENILRDQLERIAKFNAPPVQPIVTCPHPWNYRNHIQFHLTPEGKLGFMGAGKPESVLSIRECHLPEEPLNALWPQLDFEPDTAIERVALRLGTDSPMLVLASNDPTPPEVALEAGISVVHLFDEDAVVLAGESHISMEVLGRPFNVSAASFFQVNTVMAEKMVNHILALLPEDVNTVMDVYCGVGLFSAFLAPRCERLIGVESSPSACEDFVVNLDEFDHVELYEGRAEEVIPHIEARPDLVLVDPPRAGLDRRVVDAIAASGAPTLIYVSCDPSTLARDAARFVRAGYHLEQVTPFDLFPQTYHIEAIALFLKG